MTETRAIGEILRDAAAGNLSHILAENREPYDAIGAAERLFELLERRGIRYALVGGIAMLQYVSGRNTEDIDLIVAPSAPRLVPEFVFTSKDKNFGRATFDGIQVDLLFTTNKLFEHVRNHHTQVVTFGSTKVVAATPEGLLLMKLFALPALYRQGESHRAAIYESDIAGLLTTQEFDIDSVLAQLAPHVLETDLVELRQLIDEIRTRSERFGGASK